MLECAIVDLSFVLESNHILLLFMTSTVDEAKPVGLRGISAVKEVGLLTIFMNLVYIDTKLFMIKSSLLLICEACYTNLVSD